MHVGPIYSDMGGFDILAVGGIFPVLQDVILKCAFL